MLRAKKRSVIHGQGFKGAKRAVCHYAQSTAMGKYYASEAPCPTTTHPCKGIEIPATSGYQQCQTPIAERFQMISVDDPSTKIEAKERVPSTANGMETEEGPAQSTSEQGIRKSCVYTLMQYCNSDA